MPFFSIIIPTYNRRELLKQSLMSVWRQTFTDYELIVSDGGSADGTVEYLHSLGSRVRMLSQPNNGPGAARNLGVAQARGDYLAFLDSDDLWFRWTLETYAAVIREANRPAFIAGKPFRFQREDDLMRVSSEAMKSELFSDYLASCDEWRWWGVSSFVIRKDAMQKSGGFAEVNMNGEDADLALKLGDAPGFVQIMSPRTFAYREHDCNLTSDLGKTIAGIWHKMRSEEDGQYPGGKKRARERWRILTRHVRPVALECLQKKMKHDAWELYRATFGWHVALRRWKFLFGFPFKALLNSPS